MAVAYRGSGAADPAQPLPPLRVTPAIAVLCTAVWVLYRLSPSGAWRPFLLLPATFSPLSMFTAPFIHLTPFHLGTNLVLLILFGPPLERRLGSGLFLLLYLGAGLLAALLHLSIAVCFQIGLHQYASGASGAIAGLMGAYTVLNPEPAGPPVESRDSSLSIPQRVGPRAGLAPGAAGGAASSPRTAPVGQHGGPAAGGLRNYGESGRNTADGLSWRVPPFRTVLLLLVVAWIFGELLQGCINLLNGVEEVAHWAHIGGFLFGLIIMVAMGQGTSGADQLLTDGRLLLSKGQYPEAERVLERAWSLQPNDPATVLSLARAKQAVGAGETARELLAAALEQEVRDGNPDRVIPLYLEARTLAPRLRLSREAFYRIGTWLGERGVWAEACAALERAAGAGGDPRAGAESALDETAQPLTPDGVPRQAAKAAPPKEDPLAGAALYHAAELALTRLQQPERAASLLERLLREQPNSQWQALAERSLRQLQAGDEG